MKKTVLTVSILLFFALALPSIPTFPVIPRVSATSTEDLRHVTTLSEPEPIPENTTEDYLNTTNPYANYVGIQGVLDEVDDLEGNHPLYVLVFGDEEERETIRHIGPEGQYPVNWETWATLQMERGDESLVANFGIDIRILGFLEWDSDDSIEYMDDPYEWDLCDELLADKGQDLRAWYHGEWWSGYVDAIIGTTAQATPEDPYIPGIAPSLNELDQGKIFVLLKWQVYWMDDNLVQHEVSHLYYADDHYCPPHCSMASLTKHFQSLIFEDDIWWVMDYMPCAVTTYSWCASCQQTIQQNSGRYPLRTLTVSASSHGTTNPAPGTYIYGNSSSVAVTASAYSGYTFSHWLLDGATVYDNPITVTMDSDHTLKAYFNRVDDFFDGDFLEGWSYGGGGDFDTDGDICTLMIRLDGSVWRAKSLRFHSAVLEFVTVSCTFLNADSWRFIARRASDATWLYGPLSSSAETKTWVITDWCTGDIDQIGLKVYGEVGDYADFDYIAITDSVALTIVAGSGGTTNPSPGTYEYSEKTSVQVTATPNTNYNFRYWALDGQIVGYQTTITVTTDANHTLKAYFIQGSGTGCPTLLAWNGTGYVDYGVINIHDVENDVVREVPISTEDVGLAGYKAKFRLREGWEGLNYSHSLIDQVKLYAVDSNGNRYLCRS